MNEHISSDLLRRLHFYRQWKASAPSRRYPTVFAREPYRDKLGTGGNGNSYTDGAGDLMWHFDLPEHANALRFMGEAHQYARGAARGWYTSDDCSDMLTGVVFQLSAARDGTTRYAAGYVDYSGTGPNMDLTWIHDSSVDAARAADDMAQRAAEREREYQADALLRVELEQLTERQEELAQHITAVSKELEHFDVLAAPMIARAVDSAIRSDKNEYEMNRRRIDELRDSINLDYGPIEGDEE